MESRCFLSDVACLFYFHASMICLNLRMFSVPHSLQNCVGDYRSRQHARNNWLTLYLILINQWRNNAEHVGARKRFVKIYSQLIHKTTSTRLRFIAHVDLMFILHSCYSNLCLHNNFILGADLNVEAKLKLQPVDQSLAVYSIFYTMNTTECIIFRFWGIFFETIKVVVYRVCTVVNMGRIVKSKFI